MEAQFPKVRKVPCRFQQHLLKDFVGRMVMVCELPKLRAFAENRKDAGQSPLSPVSMFKVEIESRQPVLPLLDRGRHLKVQLSSVEN